MYCGKRFVMWGGIDMTDDRCAGAPMLGVFALAALVSLAVSGCADKSTGQSEKDETSDSSNTQRQAVVTEEMLFYGPYANVLEEFVNEKNHVAYAELKANHRELDAFARKMTDLSRPTFNSWDDKRKIAFWLNAYNALTLKAIIDNYPIKASGAKSLFLPKDSIRQIPGVWKEITFTIMGEDLTLDQIEHGILRKQFSEPRIHMALVCAAISCPPLRREPYIGERLDEQLNDQSKSFLRDPRSFRIDRQRAVVEMSEIFKWFAEDFVGGYADVEGFEGKNDTERAVLNFIASHLDVNGKAFLTTNTYKLRYLDYDWSLNEGPLPKPKQEGPSEKDPTEVEAKSNERP
jgi:hypothetical protein